LKDDPDIIDFLQYVDPDQPTLILFFSVINYVLLEHPTHNLAQFYPYLTPSPRPAIEAYPAFRDLCLLHQDKIRSQLVGTRLQTNEVTRCANLLPAFELVSRLNHHQPLAMIEIGASAGLNMNWHRYSYHYDNHHLIGKRLTGVQIQCSLQGNILPPLPAMFPTIASCQGIELLPLNIQNDAHVRWLRACIWPEEIERYRRLDAALSMAHQHPPLVYRGDACNLLPALLHTIPMDQTVCLWHSFALNQGPIHVKERIEQILIDASATRILYRIALEVDVEQKGLPRLELFIYQRGSLVQHEWLASCSIHGEQMEWHLPIHL
jgi:hypothetical protein